MKRKRKLYRLWLSGREYRPSVASHSNWICRLSECVRIVHMLVVTKTICPLDLNGQDALPPFCQPLDLGPCLKGGAHPPLFPFLFFLFFTFLSSLSLYLPLHSQSSSHLFHSTCSFALFTSFSPLFSLFSPLDNLDASSSPSPPRCTRCNTTYYARTTPTVPVRLAPPSLLSL